MKKEHLLPLFLCVTSLLWSYVLCNKASLAQGKSVVIMHSSYPVMTPYWTRSVQLYTAPHAIWLSKDQHVGDNLPLLKKTLAEAKKQSLPPEFVIYQIPLRDLGQSSEGGFQTYDAYLEENQQLSERLKAFTEATNLRPRIYLEPDALAQAVQYRDDRPPKHPEHAEANHIYKQRIQAMRQLRLLYHSAGCLVYLDAAHSGWFDYSENDIQRIAKTLTEAHVVEADGITLNVSNRQPILRSHQPMQTEAHYLSRLLPLLPAKPAGYEVIADTSRNGGETHQRLYYLAPTNQLTGELFDNETPTGRLIGRWERTETGLILSPWGAPRKTITRLLKKERYSWVKEPFLLAAPPWLDTVGDVKPGPIPTDTPPRETQIQKYRFIKPPDEGDGSLSYPAGSSKSLVNEALQAHQPKQAPQLPASVWSK